MSKRDRFYFENFANSVILELSAARAKFAADGVH
jgi:hypothetical protein